MSKKFSIIILTYNSENHIYECLNAIFRLDGYNKKEVEIIIVDNNSKNVLTMFENIKNIYGDNIRLIRNSLNGGYGQGNNIGIKNSSGEYILIMNPDVRLINNPFKRIEEIFAKRNDVCLIGMKQWYASKKHGLSFDFDIFGIPIIISSILSPIFNRLNIFISKYMYINGSCFFVRKEAFTEAGLFDENLFLYCEELDINKRLIKNKKYNKVIFCKELQYFHLAGDRSVSAKSTEIQDKSEIYCAQKYGFPLHKLIKRKITLNRIYLLKSIIKNKKDDYTFFKNEIKRYKNKLSNINNLQHE